MSVISRSSRAGHSAIMQKACVRRRQGYSSERHSRRRGAMLLELLVASVACLFIGAAILALMLANFSSRNALQGQNNTNAWARHAVDVLCDSIRNAQSVQIQSSPVVNSALQAGNATGITCYTNATGSMARYWLDTSGSQPALKKTVGSVTTVMTNGVSALSLTYYTAGAFTAASASWQPTADSHNPTSAELPKIGAVGISAQVNINGYTRQIACFVRLRNSPL